jgi:hypothetical protein
MTLQIITRVSRFRRLLLLALCAVFSAAILTTRPARSGILIDWTDKDASGFSDKEKIVVDAAIDHWENLIVDLGPLAAGRKTITVSITEAPYPLMGVAFDFEADAAGIPLGGKIKIDPGPSVGGFYVDDFPLENSEYSPGEGSRILPRYDHYGTALPGPAAGKKDLLTVVAHELGHVLGFTDAYSLWKTSIVPPDMLLYDKVPPTASATLFDKKHLDHKEPDQLTLTEPAHPYDLMASGSDLPGHGFGTRRLPSQLDVDILAGIYSYTVDRSWLTTIDTPLPGDYNQNGVVDGADYAVARHTLGLKAFPKGSGADGDRDGKITVADIDPHRPETRRRGIGRRRSRTNSLRAPRPRHLGDVPPADWRIARAARVSMLY